MNKIKSLYNSKRPLFKVGKKLRILMYLEVTLLTGAFFLIIFFYLQNARLLLNNDIQSLNHELLIHANSTMSNLNVSLRFPLAQIAQRHSDTFFIYLNRKNHGGISDTTFYQEFFYRANAVYNQSPDVESVLIFDSDGTLLDMSTYIYSYYLPRDNYSDGTWYEHCYDEAGNVYILNSDEVTYLQLPQPSDKLLYGTRVLYNVDTSKPLCITLVGIRATNISVLFKTQKKYENQEFALFDLHYRNIFGNPDLIMTKEELERSKTGDYYIKKTDEAVDYLYHISYNDENGGVYSVIRTANAHMIAFQVNSVFYLVLSGLLIILLNIVILSGITRSINQPLSRLVNMCEEIGKGNFDVRYPSPENDELSYLTASFNSMSEQIQRLIEESYVKTLTKRNLELQMLRSQINPHFLYNTLENMRMSAYTKGQKELSEMCLLLAKVLRYGVTDSSSLVAIRDDLKQLEYYTTLLQFCFPNLDVSICVDENILHYSTIKIIFQPLVENCVNHGIKDKQDALHIQIWGYPEGEDLIFIVSDDGVGIEKQLLEKIRAALEDDTEKGIGLKNLYRRLRLYYGEQYGLFINSVPGEGTSVTVRIPQKGNTKE